MLKENNIHQPLIIHFGVLQTKWHDLVMVVVMIGYKCSLWSIVMVHPYVVVPLLGIHETQDIETQWPLNLHVNAWQRVRVFRTCLIEVSEIYAHSPFSWRLLHYYYVSQSGRVSNLSWKPNIFQFVHLFGDYYSLVFTFLTLLLGDKLKSVLDREMMACYVKVYFWHIRWRTYE